MRLDSDRDRRNRAALFGTAAVAWMLAASKWGSHVQIGPFFVADILIGAALLYALVSYLAKPRRISGASGELVRGPHWALALLFGWAVVRLPFSNIGPGMTTLRDFAPYFYVGLGVVSGVAVYYSTERSRARTSEILWWALMFHLAWMVFVAFAPSIAAMMPTPPGGKHQIFSVRNDAESAIIAVTVAVALHRWLDQRGTRYLAIAAIALLPLFIIPSRAGLLGLFPAIVLVLAVFFGNEPEKRRIFRRHAVVAGVLPLVAMVSILIFGQTPAGNRLLATFDPSRSTADGYAVASGTTQARANTWPAVVDYTMADTSRAIVGVGFGPDFLADSGASLLLMGSIAGRSGEVRSPHNYWVGTLARLGIIGAGLAVIVALAACIRIFRGRRYLGRSELHFTAGAIVLAFLPAATFGVTFEAPFGAIPYYWAAGLILGIRLPLHSASSGNVALRIGYPASRNAIGANKKYLTLPPSLGIAGPKLFR